MLQLQQINLDWKLGAAFSMVRTAKYQNRLPKDKYPSETYVSSFALGAN